MRWIWLLAALAAFVATPARAEALGGLRVTAVDQDDLPLTSVALELTGVRGGRQQATTDATGAATFSRLWPGIYRLTASCAGCAPLTIEGVQIDPNRVAIQQIRMQGEPVEVPIEVTASAGVLDQSFLDHIPAGRSYQTAVATVPGITPAAAPAPPAPTPPPAPTLDPSKVFGPSPPDEASGPRLVHHHGWARLQSDDAEALVDAVGQLALAVGGKIERLSATTAMVRVPVGVFATTFEEVLGLGTVLDQRVEAEDVTGQFQALDQRVQTLESTLARLNVLLAATHDEYQRLALLTEIARVTEQLQVTRAQRTTVGDLAAMSRIAVEVVAPPPATVASVGRPDAAGMEWLGQLSPFNRAVGADPRRVDLPVPDGLVAVTLEGPLHAESADGTTLWTLQLPNEPQGDAAFWAEAIAHRLTPDHAVVQRTLGAWAVVDADKADGTEYHWQVCVRVVGKRLQVAQIYFPDPEQHQRYRAAVDAALGGGAS